MQQIFTVFGVVRADIGVFASYSDQLLDVQVQRVVNRTLQSVHAGSKLRRISAIIIILCAFVKSIKILNDRTAIS